MMKHVEINRRRSLDRLSREIRHAEKVAIEFEEVKVWKVSLMLTWISTTYLLYIKKQLHKSTAILLHQIYMALMTNWDWGIYSNWAAKEVVVLANGYASL